MVRIKWTLQAKDDLKNIADYISKDSAVYARRLVIKIRKRTEILKTQIRIGKIVPEIEDPDIRELIEGNYRIIYKIISKNRIDILSVHHSARDLTKRQIK
jgi:addiction module RelE/StbE family toxin